MIILGIDPGTATTGWGVIGENKGKPSYLACGVISTPSDAELEDRLWMIYKDMTTLMEKFKPNTCILEQLFFNTNAKTAFLVGQASGVVLLTARLYQIKTYLYTPLQVKMAISGYGRADKKQIQQMVKNLLLLDFVPEPDDAADALAIALTHCYSYRLNQLKKIK